MKGFLTCHAGDRPIPSCLGGGDLDGDTYNLIPLNDLPEFRPTGVFAPADYPPAPKKLLNRPSTMNDVADFVVEFIYSDVCRIPQFVSFGLLIDCVSQVVGIVASNWLIIADQSEEGIFDEDCRRLAAIHSHAVDYPKSGQAVDVRKIPKLKHMTRPDWSAPETVNVRKANYYVSHKAIGRLFRSIDLPADHLTHRPSTQHRRAQAVDELVKKVTNFNDNHDHDDLYRAVERRVQQYTNTAGPFDAVVSQEIIWLFKRYGYDLHTICCTMTLSRHRKHWLTEEEAVVGTISEKSSQPRRRKELMSTLNEGTARLVQKQREGIAGDDTVDIYSRLGRSWLAFHIARANQKEFGAQSFGWIALGCIFDVLDEIEQDEN